MEIRYKETKDFTPAELQRLFSVGKRSSSPKWEPLAKTESFTNAGKFCIYPNVAKASPFGRGGRRPERAERTFTF